MGVAGVKNADAIVAGEKTSDELGVKAVDEKTLEVELDRPVAGYLWFLSPNQKVKGLENLNLRKALSLAYDKTAIVDKS